MVCLIWVSGQIGQGDMFDLARDLYVQALADFQAANESDESSYFQVSGNALWRCLQYYVLLIGHRHSRPAVPTVERGRASP